MLQQVMHHLTTMSQQHHGPVLPLFAISATVLTFRHIQSSKSQIYTFFQRCLFFFYQMEFQLCVSSVSPSDLLCLQQLTHMAKQHYCMLLNF